MSNKQIIGFDADDTLWENEVFFHQAQMKFIELHPQIKNPEEVILQIEKNKHQAEHIITLSRKALRGRFWIRSACFSRRTYFQGQKPSNMVDVRDLSISMIPPALQTLIYIFYTFFLELLSSWFSVIMLVRSSRGHVFYHVLF